MSCILRPFLPMTLATTENDNQVEHQLQVDIQTQRYTDLHSVPVLMDDNVPLSYHYT